MRGYGFREKEVRASDIVGAFIIIPLVFYAIYQFGKLEQRKIASRINQEYIDKIADDNYARGRNDMFHELQKLLKDNGVDLIGGKFIKNPKEEL